LKEPETWQDLVWSSLVSDQSGHGQRWLSRVGVCRTWTAGVTTIIKSRKRENAAGRALFCSCGSFMMSMGEMVNQKIND